MKNLMWVLLLVVALALGWMLGCMGKSPAEEEPVPRPDAQAEPTGSAKSPEWSKIALEVEYVEGEIVFHEASPHDSAVLDQDSDLELKLSCDGCPRGAGGYTSWRIKEFVRVADLTQVAKTLVDMHKDHTIKNATRQQLGLPESGVGDNRVNIAFPNDSVDLDTPIQAVVEDDIPGRGEMWKYNIEVCACDSELGDDCSQEPTRCLDIDPHVWAHDRKT